MEDDTNMVLKTKLSEVLETLNYIILGYTIFLTMLGIATHNSELIVQTGIMFVTYIIFEYINYDYTNISPKGISSQKFGFINWKDISKIKRKDRIFLVYVKEQEKPYKIIVKKVEDNIEIERVYKYMLSKIEAD